MTEIKSAALKQDHNNFCLEKGYELCKIKTSKLAVTVQVQGEIVIFFQ